PKDRIPKPVLLRGIGRFKKINLAIDRKSTRLNSSHPSISYAVFCLKKETAGNHLRAAVLVDGLVGPLGEGGSVVGEVGRGGPGGRVAGGSDVGGLVGNFFLTTGGPPGPTLFPTGRPPV